MLNKPSYNLVLKKQRNMFWSIVLLVVYDPHNQFSFEFLQFLHCPFVFWLFDHHLK